MQAALPLMAASAVVGAVGSYKTGQYNNAVANRNALSAERDASEEALRVRQDVRQHIGGQIASQGASGFQLGTGSFTDALMESQVEGMLDVMNVRRRGASAASSSRAQGKLAAMQGNFGAASALLKGATDYASGGKS